MENKRYAYVGVDKSRIQGSRIVEQHSVNHGPTLHVIFRV